MSRTVFNFWLDVLLLVCFLVILYATAVIWFVFPPPANAGGWALWGWDYQQWLGFQVTAICLLALCLLLHIMLHWTWVCGVIAARIRMGGKKAAMDDGTRTLYGVGTLIVLVNLLGIGIAAAVLTIQPPAG